MYNSSIISRFFCLFVCFLLFFLGGGGGGGVVCLLFFVVFLLFIFLLGFFFVFFLLSKFQAKPEKYVYEWLPKCVLRANHENNIVHEPERHFLTSKEYSLDILLKI